MKNYINRIVVIFSVAMLVVSMCACGKSEVSDTTATTTVEKVSTDADATKEDAAKADSSSETRTTTELAKITTEKTTDSVTEEENAVTEKSTTESKKSESTTEKRAEITTQNQVTTQTATTQAQTTTQQSKPGNSGNNGNSQNNSQTTTSHSHTWVNHTKIVHHDAQYENQEVTKYKYEYHLYCNTCGADITNIGSDAHYAASGKMMVNCGTDDNPWWVEMDKCNGCHGTYVSVPYTEIEKVKVKDAYDEEVTDYQYCSGCGQRK